MMASGSFGHFQASESGVHKGGLDQSLVKAGFVATRISVRYTFDVTFKVSKGLMVFQVYRHESYIFSYEMF